MTLTACAACFLGYLFVRSAWTKFRSLSVFETIIIAYPLLRWLPAPVVARVVSLLELVCGVLLLSAEPDLIPWALILVTGFVLAGSLAILSRMRTGESRFACGCASDLDREDWAPGMLLRNSLLTTIILMQLALPARSTQILDFAGGLALLLSWDLLSTAITQQGRMLSWKVRG